MLVVPVRPHWRTGAAAQLPRRVRPTSTRVSRRHHCRTVCRLVLTKHVSTRKATANQDQWRTMVAVAGGCMLFCNMHRAVFAALLPTLVQNFGLTSSDIGFLQAATLAAYLTGQIPFGKLADTIGGMNVAVPGLLLSSLAVGLMAMAEYSTDPQSILLLSRVMVGLCSASILPAVSSMSAAEVPQPHRASSVSRVYALFQLGAVVGVGTTPALAAWAGWSHTVQLAASLGAAWAVAGWISLHDTRPPQQDLRWAGEDPLQQPIESRSPGTGTTAAVPWYRQQHTLSQVACLCWTNAVIGTYFFLLQNWIPMYLSFQGCSSPQALGVLSALPWLAAAATATLAGTASDRLLSSGRQPLKVRHLMQTIASVGSTAALVPLVVCPDLPLQTSAACLVASLASYGCIFSGFHAYLQDVSGKAGGTLMGVTNSCGIIAGIAANLGTGWVVDATGSFAPVFAVVGVLNVSSWVLFTSSMKGERVDLS